MLLNKLNKLLIIDSQILQTAAFDRGMGKYTSSLLSALAKISEFDKLYDTIIFLNKNLDCSQARIKAIKNIIPHAEIKTLDLPVEVIDGTVEKYRKAKKVLTQVVQSYIKKYEQVTYLVTSPFFVDFVATFPEQEKIKKLAIVYDLIPYRLWYKQKIFPDELYLKHFEIFVHADHLLTISHTVASDLTQLIGINKNKVTPINGGAFSYKPKVSYKPTQQPYIIFPSAPIVHKNNEAAVKGFDMFNKNEGRRYKLVITSTFDENTKKKLRSLSKDIIFTGNISDEELASSYKNAKALLFSSLIEGLGMPVLEAVQAGLPVACSAIPVLTEISHKAFYMFDPTKAPEIAKCLSQATDGEGWSLKKKEYPGIIAKYTWENSARILFGEFKKPKTQTSKTSLLVRSNDPRSDSPAGRLLERIYASLKEQYNTKVDYLSSADRSTHPSYVFYSADKLSSSAGNIKLQLEITDQKIFKKLKINDKKLNIVLRKRSVLNLRIRPTKDTVELTYVKKKDKLGLNFYEWQFYHGNNVLQSNQLTSLIKKRLEEITA